MEESSNMDSHQSPDMGKVYDAFADAFAEADKLPTWRYVGKRGMQSLFEGQLRPDTAFLDFGSASGRVEAGVLLPAGVHPDSITGVEISPNEVEIAKKRIPGAQFMVGDVSNPELLSDRNGTFDFVFSHMVFEHLNDEQFKRTCENAYRLLKQGGTFGFVVTHPDKMTDTAGNLVDHYGEFTTSAPWGGELHNWRRSIEDTKKFIEAAGFKIDRVEELQFSESAPEGLSDDDVKEFEAASKKYRRYPAIRLLIRAQK